MESIIKLNSESESVIYLCKKDRKFSTIVNLVGEITYKPYSKGKEFEFLAHEIIEQMLSIKAGAKIYERLNELCKGKVSAENIANLSIDEIKTIGTSISKAKSLKCLSEAVINKEIVFSQFYEMSDEEVIKKLTKLHGVGMWTAKMFLIFSLNRPDVLPFEDVAFLQSYCWMNKTDDRSKESVINYCKKWKPYSSIAARYLYRALDLGFTKQEFHLIK